MRNKEIKKLIALSLLMSAIFAACPLAMSLQSKALKAELNKPFRDLAVLKGDK